MQEVILCACNKDVGGGLALLDLHTGGSVSTNMKQCIADAGCVCVVGGPSSFSGHGSSGDFIVVAQSKKPVIHVYQWGKSQVHYQCHVQEITTALACDKSGTYLLGGTKKGWIYCWELSTGLLLHSWQAHFKSVTRLIITPRCEFCVSTSDDGMARVWRMHEVVAPEFNNSSSGSSSSSGGSASGKVIPYRSWSPHTLSIKDVFVSASAGGCSMRVMTCSTDRSIVMYDVHAGKQCYRVAMQQPLESLVCNATLDKAFAGATNGSIFILDLSVAAIGFSAAHVQLAFTNVDRLKGGRFLAGAAGIEASSSSSTAAAGDGMKEVSLLEGHSRAVTSLSMSIDNVTMVSGSDDGTVRVWDTFTRQCLRELKPLQKTSITNVLVLARPEVIGSGVHKPTLTTVEHLRKYVDTEHKKPFLLAPMPLGGGGGGYSMEHTSALSSLSWSAGRATKSKSKATAPPQIDLRNVLLSLSGGGGVSLLSSKPAHGNTKKGAGKKEVSSSSSSSSSRGLGGVDGGEGFMAFGDSSSRRMVGGGKDAEEEEEEEEEEEGNVRGSGGKSGELAALQVKLAEAEASINKLKADNERWQNVSTKLKRKLEEKSTSKRSKSSSAAAADEEVEEEMKEEEEVAGCGGEDKGDDAEKMVELQLKASSSSQGSKKKKSKSS